MARAGKREQNNDGRNVADVPENGGKRSLEGTLFEYDGEKSEGDINGGKETDDRKDNVGDFVVDIEKKIDEASKEQEDCCVE
jgi:hypothetical protein